MRYLVTLQDTRDARQIAQYEVSANYRFSAETMALGKHAQTRPAGFSANAPSIKSVCVLPEPEPLPGQVLVNCAVTQAGFKTFCASLNLVGGRVVSGDYTTADCAIVSVSIPGDKREWLSGVATACLMIGRI